MDTARRAVLRLGACAPLGCTLGAASTLGLGLLAPAAARAAEAATSKAMLPAELAGELGDAQVLGSARLRFWGLDIYEARLWTGGAFDPEAYAQSPFALELVYLRALSGRLIAERSLKEMQRQGNVGSVREQAWLQAMVQAFPDVQAGDRITGLHTPAVGARFWHNGVSRPGVRDADFSRVFFGIWLSQASSEPAMRKSLLGAKAA